VIVEDRRDPRGGYAARTYFPDGRFTMGLVGTEELAAVAAQTDVVAGVATLLEDKNRPRGLSPDEAHRQARAALGRIERIKERHAAVSRDTIYFA
jgi:hypothetical protein